MKLRILGNSIRLRLTQGEVDRLVETGSVEETTAFGPTADAHFAYVLETTLDGDQVSARLQDHRMTVRLPATVARRWAETDQVGIEAGQPIGEGESLSLLVEKDFKCLTPRPGEQDADTFPHPQAPHSC